MGRVLLILVLFATLWADDRPGLRCPGTAINRAPQLLTSTDPIRAAIGAAGHSGTTRFRLSVTETGSVEDVKFITPARLNDVSAVVDLVRDMRFCPAVVKSNYKAVTVTFDMAVPAEQ
jgi:hypothetical protein